MSIVWSYDMLSLCQSHFRILCFCLFSYNLDDLQILHLFYVSNQFGDHLLSLKKKKEYSVTDGGTKTAEIIKSDSLMTRLSSSKAC